jgi:putative membrane protein
MILEALLAYAHILAILTLVVFISSEAALCRPEWMNATVVERLVRVDRIYGIAAGVLLLTGLARVFLGVKGAGWYWSNWLLHLKFGLFVVVALLSIAPTRRFLLWRRELRASGALPGADEVRRVRRMVMMQAHIIPVIPLAAVFLARGFGG